MTRFLKTNRQPQQPQQSGIGFVAFGAGNPPPDP